MKNQFNIFFANEEANVEVEETLCALHSAQLLKSLLGNFPLETSTLSVMTETGQPCITCEDGKDVGFLYRIIGPKINAPGFVRGDGMSRSAN